MTVVPKVALLFFLVAASWHQGDALFSWKPAWKLWPLFEVGHPFSWQGPSSLAVRNHVWNDLDEEVWPVTHSLFERYPKSLTVPQQRCGGGWVQYDGNKEIDNKLNTEERQLQLRENQLRKEREDLQRRREDHERQKRQEEMRLEEQRRNLEEEERRREKFRQQQELRAREERHRLEEQRRVERQREELKRKMKEERQMRQQQELRVKEERQRLEAQRRLEKERLAARKMEEERERRRLAEENELRKQRQQEKAERERQMQEQRRKQKERESSTHQSYRESQSHPSMPKSQIATVDIPEGYDLKDIDIETIGDKIFIKGRHVCSCEENCFEREFERRTSLPNNVDTQTLTASLHPGGRLYIQGVKQRRVISPVDTMVTVEGVGLPQKQKNNSESTCKSKNTKKSGFRLKKMNARTGEIFDDIEPIEETYPLYESEVDEDGLTIEVVD